MPAAVKEASSEARRIDSEARRIDAIIRRSQSSPHRAPSVAVAATAAASAAASAAGRAAHPRAPYFAPVGAVPVSSPPGQVRRAFSAGSDHRFCVEVRADKPLVRCGAATPPPPGGASSPPMPTRFSCSPPMYGRILSNSPARGSSQVPRHAQQQVQAKDASPRLLGKIAIHERPLSAWKPSSGAASPGSPARLSSQHAPASQPECEPSPDDIKAAVGARASSPAVLMSTPLQDGNARIEKALNEVEACSAQVNEIVEKVNAMRAHHDKEMRELKEQREARRRIPTDSPRNLPRTEGAAPRSSILGSPKTSAPLARPPRPQAAADSPRPGSRPNAASDPPSAEQRRSSTPFSQPSSPSRRPSTPQGPSSSPSRRSSTPSGQPPSPSRRSSTPLGQPPSPSPRTCWRSSTPTSSPSPQLRTVTPRKGCTSSPLRGSQPLSSTPRRSSSPFKGSLLSSPSNQSQQQPAGVRMKAHLTHLEWLEEVLKPKPKGIVWTNKPANAKLGAAVDIGEGDVAFSEIVMGEAIGAGSFGAVYKGTCRGQVVAVKQCKVGDRADADMLLEETQYLRKLRHPRLVSFLGCCENFPHVVLLMEYMCGGSLHAALFGKRPRDLRFADKARMALQVVEGLTYLHEQNVVHRDLKTMNIVLDHELNCKICDLGLTITLERSHLTVKSLQGSPRYMAPEQLEPPAKITEKVDIWQMGCVFLELFCLVIPFANCTGLQQIATELLMRKRPPAIPHEADLRARMLIQACLRISAEGRPTAVALEEALQAINKSAEK